jgi:hypothetical protein
MSLKPQTDDAMQHALRLLQAVCQLAGPHSLLDDGRAQLSRLGVTAAVRRHDTPALFDWLMQMLSFQGIADRVADQYLQLHGNVSWVAIEQALRRTPGCPKLGGYWRFERCGYEKLACACAEPSHLPRCPLPRHDLRNGRLNQTAYSLFLFMRDVADNDVVQWIDRQLNGCLQVSEGGRLAAMRAALIDPMRGVYGISDKVISMALSSLLLAAGHKRPYWFDVGASFVVVDTLVHNFLHRTGILARFGSSHPYGAACYGPNGCAHLLDRVAQQIDARTLNPAYPKVFPRYVQLAIWRYCSESGRNICNGNRIDDQSPCDNVYCQLRSRCDRTPLKKPIKPQILAA